MAMMNSSNHQIIYEIINIAGYLSSADTKTTLYSIPSHVGIPENEKADQLAMEESLHSNLVHNYLSIG